MKRTYLLFAAIFLAFTALAQDAAEMINKGNEDFKAALDESITKHLADGSFAAIMEKYTGTDLTPLD